MKDKVLFIQIEEITKPFQRPSVKNLLIPSPTEKDHTSSYNHTGVGPVYVNHLSLELPSTRKTLEIIFDSNNFALLNTRHEEVVRRENLTTAKVDFGLKVSTETRIGHITSINETSPRTKIVDRISLFKRAKITPLICDITK